MDDVAAGQSHKYFRHSIYRARPASSFRRKPESRFLVQKLGPGLRRYDGWGDGPIKRCFDLLIIHAIALTWLPLHEKGRPVSGPPLMVRELRDDQYW
ncbi:protein of unknown function [Denitratisoma oestradiolicum]|uniref:Uncharacterized protein n=1 Tax=Denitratisoma oestradiolicum TaxID=311182 RepID=A0A6S6XY95_9PROT|nr:protein of unknown function [Denitratisoma oestradiolicum]